MSILLQKTKAGLLCLGLRYLSAHCRRQWRIYFSSSATTSKGISTDTSLCSLTTAT